MKNNFESIATLNKTLLEMEDMQRINPLLRDARNLMETMNQENRNVLRKSLHITAQKKLARIYATYLIDNHTIPLSPAFREKLVTYLTLFDIDDQRRTSVKVTNKAAASSNTAILVMMYQQTKAAAASNKEGDLSSCLNWLQDALAIPPVRSAAVCYIHHLEESLREQILAEGQKLGLCHKKNIYLWNFLNIALNVEECRNHPWEYFHFFYYEPEMQDFIFDDAAFERAICHC